MRTLRNRGGQIIPGRYRFREPDPTQTFGSLDALVEAVADYRRANGLEVSLEELRAEIEDWICHNIGSAWYYCLQDGKPFEQERAASTGYSGNGYQGQEKWRQLHNWAMGVEAESVAERGFFLATFAGSLPCGECRRGWKKLVRENPISLEASAEETWLWTFRMHNLVRQKIGQPTLSETEARELYDFFPAEPEPPAP